MNEHKILQVEGLKMHFPLSGGFMKQSSAVVKAVDDVSFDLFAGETFGLVGESGCGKTTTGKCVLRILNPTSGSILYRGTELCGMNAQQLKPYRRKIQMIFQDPYGSLDPRQSVASIIREALTTGQPPQPLRIVKERTDELLATVGLDPALGERYPHEMSGGQRQRLGIARALACDPELIVCDEPVSALDVSIQAQIVNLFEDLQQRLGLSYLFIAHDLAVVRHISKNIAVMYLGNIVEMTGSDQLYSHPLHPYTQALLSAIPITNYYAEKKRERIILEGDVPSPIRVPEGCPFHPRCRYATERCRRAKPDLRQVDTRHKVACHLV